ncbi:hypothetical protein OJJOAM_003773 [Cupriavidus sp. H18C1]
MAANTADIAAVQVDADRDPIVEGIAHAVDVAERWRYRRDLPCLEPGFLAVLMDPSIIAAIANVDLRAAQHADPAPHRVIVHRRLLARPPRRS